MAKLTTAQVATIVGAAHMQMLEYMRAQGYIPRDAHPDIIDQMDSVVREAIADLGIGIEGHSRDGSGVSPASMHWQYDPDVDVLNITRGKPQPSVASEVDGLEGIHIRQSLSSGEVTGVVILHYSRQDRGALEKHMPFPFDFDEVSA